MEKWRQVWRDGIAPQLPEIGLYALRDALHDDDPRLLQAATCSPPPLTCVEDWAVEVACAIGFPYWQASDDPTTVTVRELEEFFARVCFEADQALGEPAAVRWFLNWYDETPRQVVRRQLLGEVKRELYRRQHAHCDVGGEG